MIVSVNWLKHYTDITIPIEDLATLIGARLVEVENVEQLTEKYKDVVIVKVVECSDVEGSDHLHLTRIDDGGVVKDVERGDDGLVQVVCGAPNVRAGMFAAWLPPQSVVPETYHDAEPFVLGARQLRGNMSNGMLASAKELDLYEDHEGIFDVPESRPGTSFAQAYQLNDALLDIENKSLTHRPDTFGIVGFAREVAAIQGHAFETPEWLRATDVKIETDRSVAQPNVTIDDPALSDRYQAVVLDKVGSATELQPLSQTLLARSEVRPISPVVDITNYLMLLSGQPLHAFDYDKLLAVNDGHIDIHVRGGRPGETLTLLDGRTIELDPTDIVIANGNTAVALAGAMGGAETEIDDNTTRILVESATFNLYHLRTTQMRHGIFSEAITRFTKGQPAGLTAPVLAEATRLLREFTGAEVVSEIGEAYPNVQPIVTLTITVDGVNKTLGSAYSAQEIATTLRNVEFTVEEKGDDLIVTAPYWRSDIHIVEDLYEEIGRINSYDSIPPTLPLRDFTAVQPDDFDQLRARLRQLLTRAGANEVLTYSFVHGEVMRKAGQNPDDAYRVVNSISPELQYYRQSLTPSLLTHIHPNIKMGYEQFALFELNKFHTKKAGVTDEAVPKELDGLAFVISQSKKLKTAAYYEAKRYVDYLMNALNIEVEYEPLEAENDYPVTQPFEPRRSARIWDKTTRERIGVVGEYKRSVVKAFKLPDATAGFEIAPRALAKLARLPEYVASSKFPGSERDVCFKVANEVTYAELTAAINDAIESIDYQISVAPLDVYQPEDGATKNITVRLTIVSLDTTLTSDEVNQAVNAIIQKVIEKTQAVIV